MSSQKTSPPRPMRSAFNTRDTASWAVMKKRVASGLVTGTGCPCCTHRNMISTTLPLLPRMLPKRTAIGRKVPLAWLSATSSASRLVAPMTLRGSAALSDEINRKRAPASRAAATVSTVPSTLVRAAGTIERSAIGTCLYAAA